MKGVFIIILCLFFLAGCSQTCREDGGLPKGSINLEISRLDNELFAAKSPKEVESILKEHHGFSLLFLHSDQYPSDSLLAEKMYNLVRQPSMDTLYREASKVFSDLEPFRIDLGSAIFRAQSIFPEIGTPVIETAVTGLYNDLYISDTLIIVGLDYFIGPSASYRPMDIPTYILKRYDAAHLVSTITKFMIGAWVEKGKSETLLSEMIDFGKAYYIQSRVLPCTPDSILMGYTTKEMKLVQDNEPIIWANFVENEILYETNHFTKRKFLGERPNVYEINQDCPGRVGGWVGWRIVESYMANNSVSMKELAEERDHDKIFRLAGYKPR